MPKVNRRRRRKASVLSVQARVTDHRRHRSHRLGALISATFAFVALVVALVLGARVTKRWLFVENPRFEITKLDLSSDGPNRPPKLIAEFAHVRTGMNLFAVSPSMVRAQLLSDPLVKDVVVRRTLPDTLSISLKERIAVAKVATKRASYAMAIDDEGVILGPSIAYPHLPAIRGVELTGLRPGDGIDDPAMQDALRLLRRTRAADLSELMRVEEIQVEGDESLMMRLDNGQHVRLPRDRQEGRLLKLAAILRHPRGRVQHELDLTAARNCWGK